MKLQNTYQLGFDLVVAVFHQGYSTDQVVVPMGIHVSVVLVENDLPTVFAHCILACYTVLVCGNQSTVVGSDCNHQQVLPMLALAALVDACHRPKDFKQYYTICHVYCFIFPHHDTRTQSILFQSYKWKELIYATAGQYFW